MKKFTLLFAAIVLTSFVRAQDCSDLFISEYVEGWNNNKALEIYNPTPNVITFTDQYRLIRWSNGSTTSDQDPTYVLPLVGEIHPFQTVVLIQDTNFPGQDTMVWAGLRAKGTYLAPADYNAGTQGCRVVFWNGDDAVSLQHFIGGAWVDIDIFAEIGIRPLNWQGGTSPAGAWTDVPPFWRGEGAYLTQNQSLVRKKEILHGIDRAAMNTYGSHSTGGFPDSFNAFVEYDSLPANFFDSLGFHTCNCKSLNINDITNGLSLQVYPNPVAGDYFTIASPLPLLHIELLTLVGQQLFSAKLPAQTREVKIPVQKGMRNRVLLLKATTTDSQTITQKIVVR